MNEQQVTETEIESEATRETLNLETARISWKELEVYYAAGNVISVSPELDLIDVAIVITKDNAEQLKEWTEQGLIDSITDKQAKQYADTQATVWAVVIKPWILIQSDTS